MFSYSQSKYIRFYENNPRYECGDKYMYVGDMVMLVT